ncbi:hypothetical protein ElyMa_002714000 [Elysia marginata]|uniref:Secreted protein n=1 Tax=Elysia marginata TaxID=1093978 RepID=A0AAV4HDC7_9GAST|nr:hypothetical protein ElyMa_002714000 [Elysia marginata]
MSVRMNLCPASLGGLIGPTMSMAALLNGVSTRGPSLRVLSARYLSSPSVTHVTRSAVSCHVAIYPRPVEVAKVCVLRSPDPKMCSSQGIVGY